MMSPGFGTSLVDLDRRDGERRSVDMPLGLMTLSGDEVLRCRADNVSRGGLHGSAPVGFGLAVGQRFEVLIGPECDSDFAGLFGEGHYATVVRTEILLSPHSGVDHDQVGFGLRFDMPLVW
jgi:hypothetical protein